MNTQNIEPDLSSSGIYLNVMGEQAPVLELLTNLLNEPSKLKKKVAYNPKTVITASNTLLGAMATGGSEELMGQIWKCLEKVLLKQIQRVCIVRGWSNEYLIKLKELCDEITLQHPFAHRTTVQQMINGHTKESSDSCLGESFALSMGELEKIGYLPPEITINQDPHFTDFKPFFKNQEIRQILIGGRTTLRTGYQFNVSNISPLGLYNAIALAPKRQKNQKDLGDLQYAVVYGKAIERANSAGLSLKHLQADRGLAVLGVFAISQQHSWPTIDGNIGMLERPTQNAFLVTPWCSTHMTKQDLFLDDNFSEVTVKTSDILRSQYAGNQSLVQSVLGPNPKCKVPIETVILTLRKQSKKYCSYNARDVRARLLELNKDLLKFANDLDSLQKSYVERLRQINPKYTDRGIAMKLNSKTMGAIANETDDSWAIRKQYKRMQSKIRTATQKRDAFVREFQVFEIGVDHAALVLLKGTPCKEQIQLINELKSCAKDYGSRWCIESGFETIEYQFPLNYQGYSSDSHLRYFVIQTILFNSYRVAQIKHIGARKPHNWRPWKPRKKLCCRPFSAADRKGFSAKGYLLGLLGQSLNRYFCRTLT